MRYAGVIYLLLLCFLSVLYLTSFGLACVFISTRTTRPWLRRGLDSIVAIGSLYGAGLLWFRFAPELGSPSIALLTFPCALGIVFGLIYATIRRYSLP